VRPEPQSCIFEPQTTLIWHWVIVSPTRPAGCPFRSFDASCAAGPRPTGVWRPRPTWESRTSCEHSSGSNGQTTRCSARSIDGTVDFAAGGADWGTLIGLEVDGHVVVGVCDLPVHQRRYWAVTGGGAFCLDGRSEAPRALHVSAVADLRSARSYLPPPQWVPNESARAVVDAVARATAPEPHVDHPALQVAAGGYELAVFLQGGPWDVAALAVIVEEAGGRFTDITGRYDLTAGTAIFSNGVLHGDVLQLLSSSAAAEST
jgi:histidinol-phosphatase